LPIVDNADGSSGYGQKLLDRAFTMELHLVGVERCCCQKLTYGNPRKQVITLAGPRGVNKRPHCTQAACNPHVTLLSRSYKIRGFILFIYILC